MRKQLKWQLPVLALFIIATFFILHKQSPYQDNRGMIFGTVYHITYQYENDLQQEIEDELNKVDASLSPFNKNSIISKINRNEAVKPDSFFITVFNRAEEISKETEGAFDITIAPLANAWGFGFKQGTPVDSLTIDSLRKITDYRKVSCINGEIKKEDSRIMLSCSAIAKGYGSDVVAHLFDRKGIKNYMVEIGGEVVVKGDNTKQSPWRIGINKPIDDSLSVNQELQTILKISNVGMATSGNYRNFYHKDGKKYAHTIDPRTGYPVQHSLLSATVIAKDCMSADAYATAFMVMGMEKAIAFSEAHPEIETYFIYTDEKGNTKTHFTKGMEKYMVDTETK
ncbi:MAG: FAD:protein FMN transferase [Bacteroides sp.]